MIDWITALFGIVALPFIAIVVFKLLSVKEAVVLIPLAGLGIVSAILIVGTLRSLAAWRVSIDGAARRIVIEHGLVVPRHRREFPLVALRDISMREFHGRRWSDPDGWKVTMAIEGHVWQARVYDEAEAAAFVRAVQSMAGR